MPYLKRGEGTARFSKGGLADARATALAKQAARPAGHEGQAAELGVLLELVRVAVVREVELAHQLGRHDLAGKDRDRSRIDNFELK